MSEQVILVELSYNSSFIRRYKSQSKFTMEYWSILLSIAIGALGVYYFFKEWNLFKRHGVIHLSPIPLLGSMAPVIFRRVALCDYLQQLYNTIPDAKYFGFYGTTQPIFLLRDPDLVKETFVKNFETFPNRRGFLDVNDPLMAKNLFSLRGQKWRDVRNLLSPSFTSSKMKAMFVLMSECAVDFSKFLSTVPADKRDMDVKDTFSKYTTDVIATCAFGIQVDSMKDPTNAFHVNGKEATSFIAQRALKFLFIRAFPMFSNMLGLKLITEDITTFFKDIIKTTITTRDKEKITRPDMIQLMMDIRGKRESERELDIDDMTAQAFIFFFGGFDTSSTAMSFAAYEIATHPKVQARLRKEIDEVLDKSTEEVTYDVINRLEYLDAVINEVLRLYPPVVFIERVCDKDYEFPPSLPGEKPFTMKKDMVVWVPVFAIHRDKKYFDDPETFYPERFLNNKTYHNSPYYIPFGIGPRMCIANRFALLEVKVLLFHLLARCELKPCAKTTIPLKYNKKGLLMLPEGGMWLNVQPRSDVHSTIGSING